MNEQLSLIDAIAFVEIVGNAEAFLKNVRSEIHSYLDICEKCPHGSTRHLSGIPEECNCCQILKKLKRLGEDLLEGTELSRSMKRRIKA